MSDCHSCTCFLHLNPPCGECENCNHGEHPDCQTCEEHDNNRITTVEQLISQSPGRIILLSEERNKKYGDQYLLDLHVIDRLPTVMLFVEGQFVTEREYADYLPAKIIWKGK